MTRLSLDKFLPYRLSVASNLASSVIAQSYQRLFGLSVAEWRIVAILAEHPGRTQQELVVLSRLDKMTISRAVRPLVARHLVTRLRDAHDGRAHRIALSDDGVALHGKVVPAARALERRLLANLSAGERTALDTALRRIEAAALSMLTP